MLLARARRPLHLERVTGELGEIEIALEREGVHGLAALLADRLERDETDPHSEEYKRILDETESDVDKLNKIASRFSKIGSQAKLEKENLSEVIRDVCKYFEKRIPRLVGADGTVSN